MDILYMPIFRDALWLLIAAGWVLLLLTGLEADKPLSGGLPGYADTRAAREAPARRRRKAFWGSGVKKGPG
jgi:hypothetical protein